MSVWGVYSCSCALNKHQTFDVLLFLTASEKVNDVFRVGHAIHKLLAEAWSVERLEASAVVHLESVSAEDECGDILTWRGVQTLQGLSALPSDG